MSVKESANNQFTRRKFIKRATAGLLVAATPASFWLPENKLAKVQPITKGPGFHWFGYYDKLQFDPASRFALGMRVNFEHRTPTENDVIEIGMVDLQQGNQWIKLGESRSWAWQQGCMLQWIPGSATDIIWNDRQEGKFVSHILNTQTLQKRTLPKAVYAISPDGKWAIGTEFSRIHNLRPGYGYPGIIDHYLSVKAPQEIGIYKMNLITAEVSFLFSLAEIAALPHQGQSVEDNFHWFNHLLVNTDGTRFTFLHRWRSKLEDRQKMAGSGFITRMITADSEGKDRFIIDPSGNTSHFVWHDPSHICAWTQPQGHKAGFYMLQDKTAKFEIVGEEKMPVNGHNTYLPHTQNAWILNDTYPDKERLQTLYLYHVPTDKRVELVKFFSPPEYKGEWRCDLHPRSSPDGKKIVIDSTHAGKGRQMYLVDIEDLTLASGK